MRYCSRCGTRMIEQEREGKILPVCPSCGFVQYRDPKVAVGVVTARDGHVLMVQRNHHPRMGLWSFPSGFVDYGERVESAALRETWEEACVRVQLDGLIGVFSEEGGPVVFIAYAATIVEGDPAPGPEAMAVGFFPPDALPPLAFPHDEDIVRAWATGLIGGLPAPLPTEGH